MVENAYLSIRIDSELKEDFNVFCRKSGISVNAAVNQLAAKCIEKDSIPFSIKTVKYTPKRCGETSRICIRMRKDLRQGFSKICSKMGIPMSMLAKIFMLQCIDIGRFPFDDI